MKEQFRRLHVDGHDGEARVVYAIIRLKPDPGPPGAGGPPGAPPPLVEEMEITRVERASDGVALPPHTLSVPEVLRGCAPDGGPEESSPSFFPPSSPGF